MRGRGAGATAVAAAAAVAALLAGCGSTLDGAEPAPGTSDRPPSTAPAAGVRPPSVLHAAARLAALSPPPASGGPSATQVPTGPPALPLGTVAGAPGHPVPMPAGAIALTFDDGPDPRWTPQVLAVLARYRAQATFFDIGIHAAAYPSLVRAEYDAGHGVGNHTWSHPDLTTLPPGDVAGQITRGAAAITAATGHPLTCLRPPYDAIDPTVEAVVGHEHEALMLYDVDPRDWQQPGAATIVARVLAGARPGAVVDLHDAGGDRSQTLAALPAILEGLAARHLLTVPICRA